jgi:hypothetical protein
MSQTDTIADIDKSRRGHFERSSSRPSARTLPVAPKPDKATVRARGRLRMAAYRCNLDRRLAPESDVVGLALLAAVVKSKNEDLDAGSVAIIAAAFDDLVARGFARSEIENVFRRFRKKLVAASATSI